MKQSRGIFMLSLTAFIWGSSFIAQSVGMEAVDAFTFNAVRTLLGFAVLFLAILLRDALLHAKEKAAAAGRADGREAGGTASSAARAGAVPGTSAFAVLRGRERAALQKGVVLGIIYFVAGNLQQFAFYESTAGRIAFITSLYIFFVPLISLFFGKRIAPAMWLAVAGGFFGLYLLSVKGGALSGISSGDFLALLCAVSFAVHILYIERVSKETDGITLSCVQFLTAGLLSAAGMLLFEHPVPADILAARLPIAYAGVLSCGLAYTLQILGQRDTDATLASLLMCMESVVALILSALILKERMSLRELLGCAVMFASVIAATLTDARHPSRR